MLLEPMIHHDYHQMVDAWIELHKLSKVDLSQDECDFLSVDTPIDCTGESAQDGEEDED